MCNSSKPTSLTGLRRKIKLADEVMVSVLQTLSDLEEVYKYQSSVSFEIQQHEDLLAQFQSKLHAKDLEILQLRCEKEELDAENMQHLRMQSSRGSRQISSFVWIGKGHLPCSSVSSSSQQNLSTSFLSRSLARWKLPGGISIFLWGRFTTVSYLRKGHTRSTYLKHIYLK